jgi:hypothetical protein
MKIRWYQHSEHGGSSMTSLKNKLPRVAAVAMNQAPNSPFQPAGEVEEVVSGIG